MPDDRKESASLPPFLFFDKNGAPDPYFAALICLRTECLVMRWRLVGGKLWVAMEQNSEKPVADFFEASEIAPRNLAELNRAILSTRPLMHGAGRSVPGEGKEGAAIAFVGEQPGDQEDIQGRPFVGPAGQLLDRALGDAGIERKAVYITNAVKNFKFQMRGKRRIHQKPTAGEVKRYISWLDQELDLVGPKLVVALGATAAFALAGRSLAIGHNRGEIRLGGRKGFVTVHPSFLLRIPEERARHEAYQAFVADLLKIRQIAEAA